MNPEQARPTGGNAPSPAAAAATATAVPSGPTPPEPITLRIVSLDHYMAPPVPGIDVCWSELEGVAVHKVPVVRIFGATPGGQKSCLHLHGVYPYFYIPYDNDLPQDTSEAMAYARRVALSLDAALSFNNSNAPGPAPGGGGGSGFSSSRRQRVFGATLVRAIPFYGYHPEEHLFIKIMIYDPRDVKKAASLLLAGAVLGRSFQPSESHVPYLLQFKIDLNLQGMGYLTVSKGKFRGKLPAEHALHRQGWAQREIFETVDGSDCNGRLRAVPSPETSPSSTSSNLPISSKIWLESITPVAMRWSNSTTSPQRQTTCDLEFDGHAEDVLNRQLLQRCPLAQAGPEIRMVESLAPMWEEERRRCGGIVPPPPPDVSRTPRQLNASVAQYREQFQAIEDQIKQTLGMVPRAVEEEALLIDATQPANEVVFPQSQALPPDSGGGGGPLVADQQQQHERVNYSQFIDEAIITQMSVEEEDVVPLQAQPSSAGAADLGVDGHLVREVEELFARQHGDGIEEEEEDLLLALAMKLAPASLPIETRPPSAAAAAAAEAIISQGVLPLSFPGSNSQQAETYRRAQTAVEQFFAATQRECDDILECSAPQHQQELENDDGENNFGGEERQQQQQEEEEDEPFIPQVDGGFDDVDDDAPKVIENEGGKVNDAMQINQPLAAEAVPLPSSTAYISRDRVRTSGQYLSASMRFLGALDQDDNDEVNIEEAAAAVEKHQNQEQGGQIVLSANLPPTQPLEIVEEEEHTAPDEPLLNTTILDTTANDNNEAIPINNGDWWREEASQIPFDDLEWDLLDDNVGGGVLEEDLDPIHNYTNENNDDEQEDQQQQEEHGVLRAYRYRHSAPTETDLLSSGWDQGVLPVIHQGAHYSNRSHLPARAPVFEGKEYRVPCTATGELPVFGAVMVRAQSGTSGIPQSLMLHIQRITTVSSHGLIVFTPAKKPPTRQQTDAWLSAFSSKLNNFNNNPGGKRSGSAAGFTMDPNTGRLVPTRGTAPGGATVDTSQPLSGGGGGSASAGTFGGGGGGASDLLGTPSLASIPNSAPRKRIKSLQQQQYYSTPDAEVLGEAKSSFGDGGGSAADGGNDEEMRPPSPKYDEASFFYNNPYISDEAPSLRGGGSAAGGRSSRLSMQSGKDSPLALVQVCSANPENATQQQKQQQNHTSSRKSALKPAVEGTKPGKKAVAFTPEEDSDQVVAAAKNPAAGAVIAGPSKPKLKSQFVSQITPPSLGGAKTATPSSQLGFKRIITGKGQGLTLASIEVHAECRGQLLPDPRYDAVRAVVIAVTDDEEDVPDGNFFARLFLFDGQNTTMRTTTAAAAATIAVLADPSTVAAPAAPLPADPPTTTTNPNQPSVKLPSNVDGLTGCQIERFSTEAALFDAVVAAVRALDPDIILGFEIQKDSIGYLSDRAAVALQRTNLLKELSRMPGDVGKAEQGQQQQLNGGQQDGVSNTAAGAVNGGGGGNGANERKDQYGWDHASGLDIPGRIVLNVWRIMRGELKLNIYTLENCAAAVLRLRVPHIPPPRLSSWFAAGPSGGRWRCLSHLALRARLSLALLDRLDLVGRTSELARTFGIDFFAVLSRGSQYRVESMTLRLAHSQNYVTVAPSPEQVARQPAMEALPLVMEPRSALYPDPVCVLDFQSLYPSMIIAYNLCYSTCVGKHAHAAAAAAAAADGFTSSPSAFKVKLGCSEYVTPLEALSGGKPGAEGLVVAPNGVAFVPPEVRPGILPRLLSEILSTRIMVKAAMKRAPSSLRVLLRCLNARQFGLKLIANVTYGYTAAGFSGRMPMAELADAIVQSGRATLEAAIAMVESHPTWKAKVVYGDTDSLFVQLPGRTVEEAFAIGAEMAASITAANPPPVTLKLEKVYRPCVLLSKKRYVGAMYESTSQKVPNFDAKGIETVRRDSCPAVAKIMEKALRLLFASGDLSTVRMYLEKQWKRILSGRVSISDFIFAKEVRLGTYSTRAGVVPPAALVATRAMASDPRAEPRYGERVPYVVVYGEPGARLADMVVPPRALVESGGRLRLHAVYYITKQIIPAIERALSLVGADVRAWFAAMPRPQRTLPQKRPQESLPLLPDSGGDGNFGGAGPSINRAVGATSGHFSGGGGGGGALTIDRFYLSRHCAVCDELTHASKPLCERCLTEPQLAAAVLSSRCNRLGRQYSHLVKVCGACGGDGGVVNLEEGGIVCDSLDCGVYFERRKVLRELQAAEALATAGLKTLVL